MLLVVSLYHPFPIFYCTFVTFYISILTNDKFSKYKINDKSDILICGGLLMVLIFSLLLSNIFSELVLDLSIILYYYYIFFIFIHLFIYFIIYQNQLISRLILVFCVLFCYKPNLNKLIIIRRRRIGIFENDHIRIFSGITLREAAIGKKLKKLVFSRK